MPPVPSSTAGPAEALFAINLMFGGDGKNRRSQKGRIQ
jgi:hypothetical protein